MNTKRLLIFLGLGNLAVVGAVLFLFISIQNKNKDIASEQAKIQSVLVQNDQLATMRQTLSATEKDRASLDGYFVNKEKIADFLSYLEALGEDF